MVPVQAPSHLMVEPVAAAAEHSVRCRRRGRRPVRITTAPGREGEQRISGWKGSSADADGGCPLLGL